MVWPSKTSSSFSWSRMRDEIKWDSALTLGKIVEHLSRTTSKGNTLMLLVKIIMLKKKKWKKELKAWIILNYLQKDGKISCHIATFTSITIKGQRLEKKRLHLNKSNKALILRKSLSSFCLYNLRDICFSISPQFNLILSMLKLSSTLTSVWRPNKWKARHLPYGWSTSHTSYKTLWNKSWINKSKVLW